jgi:hypothetical protein
MRRETTLSEVAMWFVLFLNSLSIVLLQFG